MCTQAHIPNMALAAYFLRRDIEEKYWIKRENALVRFKYFIFIV